MIVPEWTNCPSPRLTPRRLPALSRPFLLDEPAFLCAIGYSSVSGSGVAFAFEAAGLRVRFGFGASAFAAASSVASVAEASGFAAAFLAVVLFVVVAALAVAGLAVAAFADARVRRGFGASVSFAVSGASNASTLGAFEVFPAAEISSIRTRV